MGQCNKTEENMCGPCSLPVSGRQPLCPCCVCVMRGDACCLLTPVDLAQQSRQQTSMHVKAVVSDMPPRGTWGCHALPADEAGTARDNPGGIGCIPGAAKIPTVMHCMTPWARSRLRLRARCPSPWSSKQNKSTASLASRPCPPLSRICLDFVQYMFAVADCPSAAADDAACREHSPIDALRSRRCTYAPVPLLFPQPTSGDTGLSQRP